MMFYMKTRGANNLIDQIDQLTWHMRRAKKLVFSDPHNYLTASTVRTWLQCAIFEPVGRGAPSSPYGHELSLSDIVNLSFFNALFAMGIRFTDLAAIFQSDAVHQTEQAVGIATDIKRMIVLNVATLNDNFRQQIADALQFRGVEIEHRRRKFRRRGRVFQCYFEAMRYNVVATVFTWPASPPAHWIGLAPPPKTVFTAEQWRQTKSIATHTQIDIYQHYQHVRGKLGM